MSDFPVDGGARSSTAVCRSRSSNFTSRGEWYASQNMCPHKKAFVLGRGIIGDHQGEPKVACPLHKKTFSLEDGRSLQNEEYHIQTFPVRVEGERCCCSLPAAGATSRRRSELKFGCKLATSCAG